MPIERKVIVPKGIILCLITAFLFLHFQSDALREETKIISIEVHEGTELAFDLSPDGQAIVFDLLGQIWLLPAEGGEAHAITNSIKENAEHLYPRFAADGKRIVFWDARPGSWGLTSTNLEGEERWNLTELSSSYGDSYNDRFHAYSHAKSKIAFIRGHKLLLIDENEGESPLELKIKGLSSQGITDPAWAPDGSRIAFINARANYMSHSGGRLWQVGSEGGTAEPLTPKKQEIRVPVYSPDSQYIAYFIRNEVRAFEIWIQKLDGSESRKLVENEDITPLRLCWSPKGSYLLYCAEGRLWKIPVEGGQAQEVPFTAHLSFHQKRVKLKTVQFPMAGEGRPARGNMGLEISPDGQKIAAIALGKLWFWPVAEKPVAIVKLPLTATGICWSPDSTEVAWSAGTSGAVNLFATNIETGITRRLTAIPGTEVRPSWSPDGKHIAFIYRRNHEIGAPRGWSYESLRAIRVSEAPISDLAATIKLQMYMMYGKSLFLSFGWYWGYPWSPDSKWLLGGEESKPVLISVDKKVRFMKDSMEMPSGLKAPHWEAGDSLLYAANFMLWRAPFDAQSGLKGESVPVSQDPAIYPSVALDGSVLYVSKDGLRLRRPSGDVEHHGWPLSYKIPAAPESLLIRNVRLIDGTGSAISQSCNILIEEGRISRIGPQDQIKASQNVTAIEGGGRIVIPGMIDAHMHVWGQNLLPELLYEGITTVRDMGTAPAWAKGFQELVDAGIQAGPRVVLGGFQLLPSLIDSSIPVGSYPPWGDPEGEAGCARALSLAQAFDLDYIKMYWPANSYSGAKFIDMAHELAFPVSSHLGYPLPLVAAGIDTKEHTIDLGGAFGPRFGGALYDDIIQIIKEGRIGIVPTISMTRRSLAGHEESQMERIKESPFSSFVGFPPDRSLSPVAQRREERAIILGRENVARLHRAGVLIAAGTDFPYDWMPWSLHMELEEYVRAGLSPLEAIITASKNAARILKAEKDIGTIEEGKLADLVILDANPLEDIRNTRKIWKVIQGGKVVDRDALKNWIKREAEEVAKIGK